MRKLFTLSLFLLFVSSSSYSQSFNLDLGVSDGNETTGESFMWHITPGIGYSFKEPDYTYGGIDFGYYDLPDGGINAFALFGGFRYRFNLGTTKKGTDKEKDIGIFLDPRVYFAPVLPRKIEFSRFDPDTDTFVGETAKGDIKSQLSFGIGLGLYFKPADKDAYWSLKVEYTNYDPYEELRGLDFPGSFGLPSKTRTVFGLSFFFW